MINLGQIDLDLPIQIHNPGAVSAADASLDEASLRGSLEDRQVLRVTLAVP